jgi:hypothetical protein
MAHPAGESESDTPRLNFDRRLKLEFHGSSVTSESLTHNFSGFLSGSCQSAREESNRGEEYPSLG